MEEICRLCCSTKFVNNHIFDEENALYLKMSLYLPIKVFKNDRLPQKVCDRCSCKVNDFYQFCNETIEVQNRLRAVLISTAVDIEDSVDLTLIKHDTLSPPHLPDHQKEHKVEPFSVPTDLNNHNEMCHSRPPEVAKVTADQSTQTEVELIENVPADSKDSSFRDVEIKEERKQEDEVKMEEDDIQSYPDAASDNSEDDITLLQVQQQKRTKKSKVSNGGIDKRKRKKKNDSEMSGWDILMRALPKGMVDDQVKQEPHAIVGSKIKTEQVEYHCCICFVICYSRSEMLEHYKNHAAAVKHVPPPEVPPPESDVSKCPRCQKRVESSNWSEHWARHWDRDRRPYRCALCERVFRDHHAILKHGLSHKWGEESTEPEQEKRFVCDLCPEGFVHMRYLLAHRARAHPEAAAHTLTLRCFVCGRSFAHLNSLRRHLRAHTGERNFLCNVCGKALSSREHLKFHIRIHTGYKPNVCKTCGKGFVKKCNLTLHERVHSGERPHVCPVCGKAFSQRSTLVIHERYHSGARPYVCGLCQRGFVAKGLLSMHLKTTCI